jgi:addiction module HigA family antidote
VKLDVAASTLSRILKGAGRVTPEMALRLSSAIGRSRESWRAMQDMHDLWVARQRVNLQRVGKLKLAAA